MKTKILLFAAVMSFLFSTYAAASKPPATFDINKDADGFYGFADCKRNLQDTLLAATGLIESTQSDAVKKIRDDIAFSKLTEVKSTHCGMGSEGCAMTMAKGTLRASGICAGQFTLEFGKGSCNIVSISLNEQ